MYTDLTYEEVLKNYTVTLSNIANRYNYYSNSLEDIIQAGKIGLYNAYMNYDSTRKVSFKTYAYNMIRKEIKKETIKINNWMKNGSKTLNLIPIVNEDDFISTTGAFIKESDLDLISNPEDTILRMERIENLQKYINELPDLEKKLLELFFFEELTQKEISKLLGYTRQNIQRILKDALIHLKEILIKEDF